MKTSPVETVLIVETEVDELHRSMNALTQAGYDTTPAASGPGAMALLRAWVPDVLVLDLPGLGLAWRQALDSLAGGPSRIFRVVGAVPARSASTYRHGAVDAQLPRPFTGAQLLRTIGEVLADRPGTTVQSERPGILIEALAASLVHEQHKLRAFLAIRELQVEARLGRPRRASPSRAVPVAHHAGLLATSWSAGARR